MKLGKSQRAVLDLLKCDGSSYTQFFGDQLYEKMSCCFFGKDSHNGGYGMGGKATPEEIRKNWAAKLLNELKKKGLVDFNKEGRERIWFLTEAGKNA